ncbi:hypothetical protein RYX36_022408 [Vicia faba]
MVSSSPPLVPKKARSKVQARKSSIDGKLNKKFSKVSTPNTSIHVLCSKCILELNGIKSKEEDLEGASVSLDESVGSKM